MRPSRDRLIPRVLSVAQQRLGSGGEPLAGAGRRTLLALREPGVQQVECDRRRIDGAYRSSRRRARCRSSASFNVVQPAEIETGVGKGEQDRTAQTDRAAGKSEAFRAQQGPVSAPDIAIGLDR